MRSILKFIQGIPKEKKTACLLSVIMGIVASVLVAMCFGYPLEIILDEGIFQKWVIGNIVPFLSIILLLILLKRFSPIWKNFRARFFCILFFLLTYIYGFFVIGVISSGGTFWRLCEIPAVSFFVFVFSIIWLFTDPIQSPLLEVFLYSNIFIIIAAYLATKGIDNLVKRIILFFIIGFLICITTAIPFLMMHISV